MCTICFILHSLGCLLAGLSVAVVHISSGPQCVSLKSVMRCEAEKHKECFIDSRARARHIFCAFFCENHFGTILEVLFMDLDSF